MTSTVPDAINHYREAETTLEVVEFANGAQTSPSYTEYALAEATLALAYEQRTANLIALFAVESDSLPALAKGGFGESAWIEAAEQITERLGLG
jgi:hypothetical protein